MWFGGTRSVKRHTQTEDRCPVPSLVKRLRNTNHLEAVVHTHDPSNIEDVCLIYRTYLGLFGQLG